LLFSLVAIVLAPTVAMPPVRAACGYGAAIEPTAPAIVPVIIVVIVRIACSDEDAVAMPEMMDPVMMPGVVRRRVHMNWSRPNHRGRMHHGRAHANVTSAMNCCRWSGECGKP